MSTNDSSDSNDQSIDHAVKLKSDGPARWRNSDGYYATEDEPYITQTPDGDPLSEEQAAYFTENYPFEDADVSDVPESDQPESRSPDGQTASVVGEEGVSAAVSAGPNDVSNVADDIVRIPHGASPEDHVDTESDGDVAAASTVSDEPQSPSGQSNARALTNPDVLDGSVNQLRENLDAGGYDDQLKDLLAAEQAGENRTTAVRAIQERIEQQDSDEEDDE